jgi:plastocyanin
MRRATLLLLVLGLLCAGCGGGGDGGDDDLGLGGTETGTSSGADYEVFASEFAFAPPFIIVDKAGTYTFSLRNDGSVTHNLTIKGVGKIPDVDPGETATATLTLKAGQHEFYCSIGDHQAQGMDGTLNVLAPAS